MDLAKCVLNESEIITKERFKTEYKKCRTYGDFDRLLKNVPVKLLKELRQNIQFTNDTVGLTMREEAFLSTLKFFIKDHGIDA